MITRGSLSASLLVGNWSFPLHLGSPPPQRSSTHSRRAGPEIEPFDLYTVRRETNGRCIVRTFKRDEFEAHGALWPMSTRNATGEAPARNVGGWARGCVPGARRGDAKAAEARGAGCTANKALDAVYASARAVARREKAASNAQAAAESDDLADGDESRGGGEVGTV